MKQPPTNEQLVEASEVLNKITTELSRHIIGQEMLISRLVFALCAKGHILLEGVPGLAKTRSIKMLASSIDSTFKRIQFTPDLLPSDITGNLVFNPKESSYIVKKGPVFANFVLADEINRAPAKVQSALLEAMQEKQVTIGDTTYELPKPFFVLATQNPIEQEGTYPLPEAQIDRFLIKTVITYPTLQEELKIIDLLEDEPEEITAKVVAHTKDIEKIQNITEQVYIDPKLKEYIAAIVQATRTPGNYGLNELTQTVQFGSSPRGTLAFMKVSKIAALLAGRNYVIPEDIREVRHDVLRHRLILSYEAEAEGVTTEWAIDKIFEKIPVP
ncbi:MAG: MoxR family ATPase [Candidatus Dojkabacteria bacterium]|nr:MAG: MoxR family ATPase [Candidatus Dojkabacteria bacterium]